MENTEALASKLRRAYAVSIVAAVIAVGGVSLAAYALNRAESVDDRVSHIVSYVDDDEDGLRQRITQLETDKEELGERLDEVEKNLEYLDDALTKALRSR